MSATPWEDPAVTQIRRLPLGTVLVCSLALRASGALFCQLPDWQLSPSCSWGPEPGARTSPWKSLSRPTALPSGLPLGDPTASGVDRHPQSSEESSHLSRKHAARRGLLGAAACSSRGWDHGGCRSLQTDVGFGVQRGTTRPQGVEASPSQPPVAQAGLRRTLGGRLVPAAALYPGLEVGQLGLVRDSELGLRPAQPWGSSPSENLGPGLASS